MINENLSEIESALTLLHETAHFLNGDCEKYISNHFQNDNMEFQANRYMIQEVMKMLDEKYDFTPNSNYQKIIDALNLPYHLDGIIIDEFNNIISDKFGMARRQCLQETSAERQERSLMFAACTHG